MICIDGCVMIQADLGLLVTQQGTRDLDGCSAAHIDQDSNRAVVGAEARIRQ